MHNISNREFIKSLGYGECALAIPNKVSPSSIPESQFDDPTLEAVNIFFPSFAKVSYGTLWDTVGHWEADIKFTCRPEDCKYFWPGSKVHFAYKNKHGSHIIFGHGEITSCGSDDDPSGDVLLSVSVISLSMVKESIEGVSISSINP